MVQASVAETKKYEEVQQSEQGAFQASITDLEQAVASMQTYTDMSVATAVAEEVTVHTLSYHPSHAHIKHLAAAGNTCCNMYSIIVRLNLVISTGSHM